MSTCEWKGKTYRTRGNHEGLRILSDDTPGLYSWRGYINDEYSPGSPISWAEKPDGSIKGFNQAFDLVEVKKTEKVKLFGWFDRVTGRLLHVVPDHPVSDDCVRVPSEDKEVEIEE